MDQVVAQGPATEESVGVERIGVAAEIVEVARRGSEQIIRILIVEICCMATTYIMSRG
jgi:hypothetical protein